MKEEFRKTLPAASTLLLDGRTLHRAERTENAAVARIGTQQAFAIAALVEKLASVRRHGFLFGGSAMRTGQDGFKNNVLQKLKRVRIYFTRWVTSHAVGMEPAFPDALR